jgi:hypothetical protein
MTPTIVSGSHQLRRLTTNRDHQLLGPLPDSIARLLLAASSGSPGAAGGGNREAMPGASP